ncbi:UNVERIFIED_CONTAM: hypothetical protein FKN15_009203 [Acipenser sinensis]
MPPRIEGYDRPEVKAGETLSLECKSIGGNPLATLQWSKNDEVISTSWDTVSLTNTARSLLSLHIQPEDNMARLTCEAVNQVTPVPLQHTITLRVVFLPSEVKILGSSSIAEKKQLSLSCFTAASNPPVQIRWWLGFRELTTTEVSITEASNGGRVTMSNLTHTVSREENGLQLTCEAFNEAIRFTKSESVLLRVLYSPSIKSLEDPTEVDLGDTAEIVCTADANPVTPGMFWWGWLGEEERELTADQQVEEGATGKLVITETKRSDAGLYECTVDNGIAPSAKQAVRLIVRFKPELQKGVHLSKVATSGDGSKTATLSCKAEGIPKVEYSWAKNGVGLDLNHPRYSEDTVHEGALHTSTLTIINASAALDYAIFTCTARNKLGLDVFHIQLVSTSRPDPPTGLQVASVTHNSVTLQWTAGFDGGLEQKFRVRYHWDEAASFMYVDVFPPQATTFTITGLNAETPYNFSVNALNLLGESDYADGNAVLTVTTREGPVLPLYLIVMLAVVGGVLLILNSALVACLVKKWRTHHSDAGRGSCVLHVYRGGVHVVLSPLTDFLRSSLTKPNEYGGGELLNKAARQTLLIDSCSELSSSVYESYEGDSASERGHYYYPASDFRPSLYPHQEAPECLSEGTSSFAGKLKNHPSGTQ